MSLSSLEEPQVFKCCLQLPKGHYTEDGSKLFSEDHLCKSRGNRHKLQQDIFYLDERKNKYHHESGQALEQVPREAVESLFLEIFRRELDTALSNPTLKTAQLLGG